METNNRCSKCDSTLTYLRIRNKERVCRSCGHMEKIAVAVPPMALDEITEEIKEEIKQ